MGLGGPSGELAQARVRNLGVKKRAQEADEQTMTLLAIAQSFAVALTISLVWVAARLVELLQAEEVFEGADAGVPASKKLLASP